MSGSIEGRHLEASDDGAGCGARGRETKRSSQALGRRRGSARRPIRAACQELADGERRLPSCSAETKSAARCRRSVYDCGRSGPKTTANEPGHFKDVRAARQEAPPHLREKMRIPNRRRQRPLARQPLASGGATGANWEDGPARGLDQEYGRCCLGLADCLAGLLEVTAGACRQHL
jgi:hypothetical protein